MNKMICLTALLLLVSVAAFADIPRPEPAKTPKHGKQIDSTMTIRLDHDAKETRLIIPRSQLKQLRAELEQMDDESDTTAALSSPGLFTRTRTIATGLFISLALVFCGVWFMRSGNAASKVGKTIVVAIVTLGVATAATLVYANAGPPAEARSITGKMFSQAVHIYNFGSGKIKLEAGDKDQVELIVPDPPSTAAPGEE